MKRIFTIMLLLTVVSLMPGLGSVMAQTIVTGKVVSTDDGYEAIGCTVVETDRNGRVYTQTITDINGEFSLQVKNTSHQLVFTYVGYKKQTVAIGNKRRFDISMESDNVLTEVVVKGERLVNGGGMQVSEREFSGAMQRFSMDKLEGVSVPSIDDALQGRIAGLDIVGNSGDLGSGSVMRIRGVTSINSNSQPLILLNNVPYENNIDSNFDFASADQEKFASLLSISPDDIQEITVLKDGAACAIWGARGANGIINITTKKGVTGPTRVNYSYRLSCSWQPKGTKLLNGDEYTMLMKQAYFNRNQQDCNIPEYSYDREAFVNAYGSADDYLNFTQNTDWVDAVRQTGYTHDHVLSVQGGGSRARFRASVGLYDQSGTIIGQDLKRFTGLMNLEYNVSDRLKFTSEFFITNTKNNKNYQDGSVDNLLSIAYKKMPNVGIYRMDAQGNATDVFFNIAQSSQINDDQKNLANPVAIARLAKYDQDDMRIMPTLRLQYDFIEPRDQRLRYAGYVKFDIEDINDSRFRPRETTSKKWDDSSVNRSYSRESQSTTIYMDHNLTWMPRLDTKLHSLMLYGSWQMNIAKTKYQEFERSGLSSTDATDVNNWGQIQNFNSSKTEGRNMAFLASTHYMFLNRYIFDASARWDGSSRFGSDNRWGFFPSMSGKWIVSSEPWMKSTEKWLSELSVRAGWGVTGNRPDYEYLYFSRYNSFNTSYGDIAAIKPASLQLSNLKWERSSSYNVGIESSFLDYRLRVVANIYKRRTENLLFRDQTIPSTSGFSSISYINAGTMDNKGWEFELSTDRMIKKGKWQIDMSLNLSNYRNTIVELDPTVLSAYNKDFDYQNGSYLTRLQIENSFGSIYGFRYKGVYQYDKYQENNPSATAPVVRDAKGNVVRDAKGKPVPMYYAYGTSSAYQFRGGDAIYEDVNGDGTIDELDIVYLGNSNPKFDGGIGLTVKYDRLSLNIFSNFRVGGKIINYGRMYAESMYTTDNQSIATNWRWRKDGDVTGIPRALYQYGYNWLASDRFVENGSFFRIKQITLNYSFDPKALKRVTGLSNLSMALTLNNLFTFTKYTGADPEVSPNSLGVSADNNHTPRSRYFTFALNVGI